MWTDADGVAHTVALPSPTDVMSERFKSSLDQLVEEDVQAVAELIKAEKDRFFDGELGGTDLDTEDEYEGAAPPLGLLDRSVRTTVELRSTLAALDIRWRLDALWCLRTTCPEAPDFAAVGAGRPTMPPIVREPAEIRADTYRMSDHPWVSPSDKSASRDASRKGDKIRRRAIQQAMIAGWADEDADEANWLDEAAQAHPGPDSGVHFMYGLARRLVERLAETTGEDREQVLKDALR